MLSGVVDSSSPELGVMGFGHDQRCGQIDPSKVRWRNPGAVEDPQRPSFFFCVSTGREITYFF